MVIRHLFPLPSVSSPVNLYLDFFFFLSSFLSFVSFFINVGQTPMRDQFGLNDMHSDSFSVSDAASVSSRFDKVRVRNELDTSCDLAMSERSKRMH